MPPLYPLRFAPIFKTALWGGRRIADMLPGAPAEGPVSEAWLISDVDDHVSVVADGPLAGMSLRDLMRTRRVELGLSRHQMFPLLIKIIDAAQPLSVQVHPNDEQAQLLESQPRGKSEAWYVLHAEPGARIYAGFKSGVDRAAFLAALEAGRVEETLHSFEAQAGDCVFLPAGTIHAAGAGLTIFEVQQTSDLTYRLHDWGRIDSKTGKPRELHLEKALACLDFERGPVHPIRRASPAIDSNADLLTCNHFELRRAQKPDREFAHKAATCHIHFCLAGAMNRDHGEISVPMGSCDAVVIPPGEIRHRPTQPIVFLEIQVP